MNPRSTDCEADALTTTPSRRFLPTALNAETCFAFSKFGVNNAINEKCEMAITLLIKYYA